MQHRDVERTIGINTGYIQTNDYDIEDGDKKYLWEVNISFVHFYIKERNTISSSKPDFIFDIF